MLQFECDERITSIETRLRSALLKEVDAPASMRFRALSEQTGVPVEEMKVLFYKEYGWWVYRVGIMSYVDDLPVMERFMFDHVVRTAYGNPGPARMFYESSFKPTAPPDAVRYIEKLLAQQG